MCGIAGYFCFGKKRPEKRILNNLLEETQIRGKDATGISFIKGKALHVIKAAQSASKFVESNEEWLALEESKLPKYMIMHTRYKTKGDQANNMNNHPVFRDGLALVHNGGISNDDDLYDEFKFSRDAQVDTEAILALLEDKKDEGWSGMKEQVSKLRGSFAVAAIDTRQPNSICFFRHTNPIEFAIDEENDILYFASTENILDSAIVDNYRGIVEVTRRLTKWDIKNDTGIILDDTGIVEDFGFTVSYYNNYSRRNTSNSHSASSSAGNTGLQRDTGNKGDGAFSICNVCKGGVTCTYASKDTVSAYDCTFFDINLNTMPAIGGGASDECDACTMKGRCDDFTGDDFYKTCPLITGDDEGFEFESTDCTACAKVDECDDVYVKLPIECQDYKERLHY